MTHACVRLEVRSPVQLAGPGGVELARGETKRLGREHRPSRALRGLDWLPRARLVLTKALPVPLYEGTNVRGVHAGTVARLAPLRSKSSARSVPAGFRLPTTGCRVEAVLAEHGPCPRLRHPGRGGALRGAGAKFRADKAGTDECFSIRRINSSRPAWRRQESARCRLARIAWPAAATSW